jgi:glycogen synthase
MYQHQPAQWLQLQQTGMAQDWSWHRSAGEYEKLYHEVVREMV